MVVREPYRREHKIPDRLLDDYSDRRTADYIMSCERPIVDVVIDIVGHTEVRDSLVPRRQGVDPESIIVRIMAVESSEPVICDVIPLARMDTEHVIALDAVVAIITV